MVVGQHEVRDFTNGSSFVLCAVIDNGKWWFNPSHPRLPFFWSKGLLEVLEGENSVLESLKSAIGTSGAAPPWYEQNLSFLFTIVVLRRQ
jgi:hypothetical protein